MPKTRTDPISAEWSATLAFVGDELGVRPSYVRACLVPGWLDAPSGDPAALDEARRLLASALQVPAERLASRRSPLADDAGASRCKGASPESLALQRPARMMAEALGRHLAAILEDGERPEVLSAAGMRARLLNRTERIDLEALLRLSWELGVPVAHLASAPRHAPHAMALNIGGRCAVVLLRNKKHQGWHLFDLAHELGHVMLGHVKPGETIVDGEGMSLDQTEEDAANSFAFELLAGTAMAGTYARSAEELLAKCRRDAAHYRVDPQWLAVCSGFRTGNWGAAGKTLNLGWAEDDAIAVVERVLVGELHRREVPRTRAALIRQLSVRSVPAASSAVAA